MQNTKYKTVDEYISAQPDTSQKVLKSMRKIISEVAPQAEEIISYGIPALKLNGILVFYAIWKNHIGFYPSGSGIAEFKTDLAAYKTSKGAIQFPLDQPLPSELIQKIVTMRVRENLEKDNSKKTATQK